MAPDKAQWPGQHKGQEVLACQTVDWFHGYLLPSEATPYTTQVNQLLLNVHFTCEVNVFFNLFLCTYFTLNEGAVC